MKSDWLLTKKPAQNAMTTTRINAIQRVARRMLPDGLEPRPPSFSSAARYVSGLSSMDRAERYTLR